MTNISELFSAFDKVNVLVVGDVMIDRYLTGEVSRISPEAPVPVVNYKNTEDRLGGAANVALNIKALGATPYLCSVVGNDEDGDRFCALLPPLGIPDSSIIRSSARPTTVKTRIMAGSQHLLRIDREKTHDLNSEEEQLLVQKVVQILNQVDIHVILFQDYNKGVLSAPVIRALIREANKRHIPTAVDPKAKNFWTYQHVTLFKPNLKEIRAQLEQTVDTEQGSLESACTHIRRQLGNRFTIITLSEKGLFLDDAGQGRLFPPAHPRAIADVSGAGDTVISVVAIGLALQLDLSEIALLANLAGGQVCERLGVVPVDKEQLLREYELVGRSS